MLRLFFLQRTGAKISLAILAISFCLILYVILSQNTTPTIFELLWLLLPPIFVIFAFIIQPAQLARRAMRHEQLAAETTWELDDAGVRISNRYGTSLIAWSTLSRMLITRGYYLLLGKANKNTFRFLPRRAFRSPKEEAVFVDMVTKYLPGR